MSTPKAAQKLFVRNLPWTIANRQLKEYFSKFGHINSVSVVFDKNTGFSRGYGFVSFSSNEAYNGALNQKIHSLEGSVLSIEVPSTTS